MATFVEKLKGESISNELQKVQDETRKNIDKIVEEHKKQNRKFRDRKFDISVEKDFCLYRSKKMTYDAFDVKRVPRIFKEPKFFIDVNENAYNLLQGEAYDCWFIASLTVIANIPGLLKNICVAKDEGVGVYGFVFFKNGQWVSTIIDDQLFTNEKDELTFAKSFKDNETWLPLIEKAFAKLHGDYESLNNGYMGQGMEDLTGGVYTSIFTSDIYKTDIFWNELKRNVRNKTMLYACARYQNANLDTKGTQKGHAYSILRAEEIMVEEISDEKLVKLKELVKIETASEDDKKKELIKLAEEFMETHKELKGLDDKFKDHREKLIGQVENIENDKQREKLKKLVEEIEDVKKHAKLKKLVEKFKNETLQVLIEEIADHKNRDKYKELVENLENEEKCDRIDKLVEEIANKEKREKITTLFEKIVDCEKRKRLKEMVIEDEKLKPLVELIVDKSEKCLENQVEEIKDDEIREELKKLLNKIENDGKREKLTELADKIVDECKNLEDLVDEIEEVIDDVEKREELKELVEEIEDTREKLKNLVEEIVDGKKREKLILIRNPYGGRPGWFGAWSDGSKEWTPECMKALGYKFGNDGAFWMTYEDFLQYWSVIDTCRLFDENWKIYQTWINYNVDPQSDGKFMLHVTEKCELVIVLQQPDDRYFIDPPKSNYLLSFRLYKENEKDVYDHNEYLYRSRLSVTYGPRSTNLQLDYLPRGKYVIIPDVDRKIKKNSGSSPSNTNLKVNVHAKTHNNVDLTVTTNDGESGNTPKNEKISDVKKRKKVLLDGYALNDEVDKSDENTKDNNWEMELGLRIYSKKEISLKGISGKCPK